jgi:hypothetical protein
MGYSVFFSNPDVTGTAGFGRVASLPCIFDARPGYHRLSSRYLIDRGLGVWSPEHRGNVPRVMPQPSKQTMRNYAYWLANFLEWAELRGLNLLTCSYAEHIQGRYQSEMLQGAWSRNGSPLGPRTVNLRVQQACDFLIWTADKGLRKAFDVAQEVTRVRSGPFRRIREVITRKGKVRQNVRRLRMPTDDQIHAWLDRVYGRFGYAKGLMCETILLTALRREEIACWRTNTLPEDPKTWHISNPDAPAAEQNVLIRIRFGTKGPDFGRDHDDKIGPARDIWIPLVLAKRLHEYRMRRRNTPLKKWVSAAPAAADQRQRIRKAVHLFLDEQSGARITSKELYNAWTRVELPYKGWSPHLGRHWWACSKLWRAMHKHKRLIELDVENAPLLIESTAMSTIQLQIQPQLGHAHVGTCMIYLQWASDMLNPSLSL